MRKSGPVGKALADKIEGPDFTLTVNSMPDAQPGALPGTTAPEGAGPLQVDPTSGSVDLDLNDPSLISDSARQRMLENGLEQGKVTDKADFDNQVSKNPAVVLGHELGHAVLNKSDEPEGDNVQTVENPIREGLGEPRREKYRSTPIPETTKKQEPVTTVDQPTTPGSSGDSYKPTPPPKREEKKDD